MKNFCQFSGEVTLAENGPDAQHPVIRTLYDHVDVRKTIAFTNYCLFLLCVLRVGKLKRKYFFSVSEI